MKCPVCNKEIKKPQHIVICKDEDHKEYVEQQRKIAVDMMKKGLTLHFILKDERIIIKTHIRNFLLENYPNSIRGVKQSTLEKFIQNKKQHEKLKQQKSDSFNNPMLIENIDYVVCKLCGLKSENISSHVVRVHELSAKEYKSNFPNSHLFCEKTRNKFKEKMLQDNPNDNPEAIAKMRKTKASTKDERSRKAKEQFASGERTPSYNTGRGVGGFRPDLGHYCRSMWEANIARILKLKDIEYEFEKEAIPFYDENGDLIDSYLPDFYLTKSKTYLEVKGQMDDVSKKKLDLLKKHHPEVKVFLIDDVVYSKMINSFKNKLDKRLEYSKRNIKTHPHLFEGGF